MVKEIVLKNEIFKHRISLAIFLFVNFAFSVKYLSRATPYYMFFAIGISIFYALFWKFRAATIGKLAKMRYFTPALIFAFVAIFAILFSRVPAASLNVDRWSVITSFWDNYFGCEFVYFAKSHMGNPPGPMPFYFILALPFYAIGELGYFSLVGILVFWLLMRYVKIDNYQQFIAIALLSTSVFYLWEVVCRSNIFLNGTLVLFSIVFFFNGLKKQNGLFLFLNGAIIGLLLSTRNVFVIPYIMTFLFALKTKTLNIKKIIIIGIICILTFVLTFVPFVIGHIADFKISNPFMIQSDVLMPFQLSFFCVALSFLGYFICKKQGDVYFYSGCLLFFTIVLHFVYQSLRNGFAEAFFGSKADISYFILCTPFLLYHILITNKELIAD